MPAGRQIVETSKTLLNAVQVTMPPKQIKLAHKCPFCGYFAGFSRIVAAKIKAAQ